MIHHTIFISGPTPLLPLLLSPLLLQLLLLTPSQCARTDIRRIPWLPPVLVGMLAVLTFNGVATAQPKRLIVVLHSTSAANPY
jgi:hypothetical protein